MASYGVSNELKKEGIFVSPGGVRSIWLRHDLETFKKRLKALEAKAAKEEFIFTESQLQALEKAKQEKEAHGEIETLHPGYLGARYLLCGYAQGSRKNLPADFYRYPHQSYLCKAI
jgi:hypothetical protein